MIKKKITELEKQLAIEASNKNKLKNSLRKLSDELIVTREESDNIFSIHTVMLAATQTGPRETARTHEGPSESSKTNRSQ